MGMQLGARASAAVVVMVLVLAGQGSAAASPAGRSEPGTARAGVAVEGAARATAALPQIAVAARRAPLGGTRWRAVLLRDESGRSFWVRTSVAPRMRFHKIGGVSGYNGCNWFDASTRYSRGHGLRIGGGLVTLQGCGDPGDSTERAFDDATDKVRRYVRHGRTLTLLDRHGQTLMVLRRVLPAAKRT
jgi:heat shock protein HslJ